MHTLQSPDYPERCEDGTEGETHFQCLEKCIDISGVCNGIQECDFHFDEQNCGRFMLFLCSQIVLKVFC